MRTSLAAARCCRPASPRAFRAHEELRVGARAELGDLSRRRVASEAAAKRPSMLRTAAVNARGRRDTTRKRGGDSACIHGHESARAHALVVDARAANSSPVPAYAPGSARTSRTLDAPPTVSLTPAPPAASLRGAPSPSRRPPRTASRARAPRVRTRRAARRRCARRNRSRPRRLRARHRARRRH